LTVFRSRATKSRATEAGLDVSIEADLDEHADVFLADDPRRDDVERAPFARGQIEMLRDLPVYTAGIALGHRVGGGASRQRESQDG
jgi:hypothetical protein